MAPPSPPKPFITILTTSPRTPLPALSSRPPILTPRLLLRPLRSSAGDIEHFHTLCAQASFMAETGKGVSYADVSETRDAVQRLEDEWEGHFWFGVFLRKNKTKTGSADTEVREEGGEEEGELIGDCGIYSLSGTCSGWPEIGYKLAFSHRGKGYATEAVAAVLNAWWHLPRTHTSTRVVHPDTVHHTTAQEGKGGEEVEEEKKERIAAEIATYNTASRRVLEKLGFRHFGTWEEPDTQLHRLGQPIELAHYML
ncbi:acyl-CoA N-acyltransferase [Xylariaceae sp. FL0594]|nr:acyl-CoA N-acyltransferase [Xylariaceae sp. FL0594]